MDRYLRHFILIPLGGVLAALLLVAVYAVDRMNRQHVSEAVHHTRQNTQALFQKRLELEAGHLSTLMEVLERDPRLIDGLARRDRGALLAASADIYPSLRTRHGITHYYFSGPDRVNLLRVHMPERHGDTIGRFTTLEAERTGREAWGIELGPMGLFTLRVVRPVFARGRLLGYLELGEEIGHFIASLSTSSGVDMHVLIQKRFLDRAGWEAGNRLLGRKHDWEAFPDVVLAESSGPLPQAFRRGQSPLAALHGLQEGRLMSWEQTRLPILLPLADAAGRQVGHLLLQIEVSDMARESRRLMGLIAGLGVPLVVALLALFHLLLRRVQERLQAARDADESARRERESMAAEHMRQLEEREIQIRLLLDSTAEAIYGMDGEGNCTFVNQALLSLMGYADASDLLGKNIHALIHHTHADGSPYPADRCLVNQALHQDRPMHCDTEVFWRKDGSPVPVEYWAHPIRRDGRVIGAVVAFLDISARAQAHAKLQASEARLKEAQRLSQLGDWELDLIHNHLVWSDEVYRIFEIAPEGFDATLEAFLGAIHPEDRERVQEAFHVSVAGQAPYEIEHRLLMPDGRVKYVRERGETRYDADGRAIRSVGTVQDITPHKQSEQQLAYLAHYDPLTRLANRTLLQTRLEHALEHAHRHATQLALLFLDLDRFKNINDSLGHPAGDELLLGISARIRARIREADTLARVGGDEFVILIEQLERPESAATLAHDLIDLIRQPFALECGHTVYAGVSIGISLYPRDGLDATSLLKNADAAMYLAKESGRNTFRFYDESLTEAADERLAMEAGLRRALVTGEFLLHYQPQAACMDGAVLGVEALVRWQPPGEAMVSPARFIPIAEETGLIVPLGEWVLRTACVQARSWLDRGLPPMTVAVNLSPRQFHQPDLAMRVARILEETGLPPDRLELEITEGAIMEDSEHAVVILRGLKALGVSIAIDDFGTGYSSLAYLKRFAIDKLKIDQSFVHDIPTDRDSMAITASIIAMAKNLHLRVLAEGVEREDQLAFLQIHGCEACQGYLFNRPLPPADLERWLATRGTASG